MLNTGRFRNKSVCEINCFNNDNLSIQQKSLLISYYNQNIIEKSTKLGLLKTQKGGSPRIIQNSINNFGRIKGTGGFPPNNFK